MEIAYKKFDKLFIKDVLTKAFFVALGIYIIGADIDETVLMLTTVGESISNILKALALIILGVEALVHISAYTKRQWIVFATLGVLSVICTITTHSYCPIILMAFWVNMKDIELEGILNTFLITKSASLAITVFLCIIGVTWDWVYPDNCHSLGYGHPNALGVSQMLVLMLYLAVRDKNTKWYDYLGGLILTIVTFVFCKSKSALIGSLIVLSLSIAYRFINISCSKRTLTVIVTALPAAMCIISIALSMLYIQNGAMEMVNKFFTGRIALGKMGMENFGITAFGQYIEWDSYGVGYNIVDNSFLLLLVNYGWVYLVVITVLHCLLGYYLCKREKWNWLIMYVLIIIHSFVEGTLVSIARSPLLVAIGILFFTSVKEIDKND